MTYKVMSNEKYRKNPLIRTLVIRIGLALLVNILRILQNYRLSDQVPVQWMASGTTNQAWSEGLDAGTYCKG